MAVTFLDPATHSVSLGSADTWIDVDNADVPDTAVAVIVRAINSNATTNRNVGWRKNGSTDARTTVMRAYERFGFIVGCDGSGVFELLAGDTTDVTFKIVGYLEAADVVMFDNATDVSIGTTGAWTDVDITSLIGANDANGVFCEWINTGADNYGVRCNGSTDDRYRTQVQHWFSACAVDADDIFEIEIAHVGTDTFVTGYALAGGCLSFNVNAPDMSIGSTGAYTDLANLPANSAGAIFEILSNSTSYYYALRKNGGTDDDYYYARAHCWDIVEAASLVVEGKIADLNVDFFRIAEFVAAGGGTPGTLACVACTASAASPNAAIKGKGLLVGAAATATGAAQNAAIVGKAVLATVLATATGTSPNAGMGAFGKIAAVTATATGAAQNAAMLGKAVLAAVAATATASSPSAQLGTGLGSVIRRLLMRVGR